MSNSSLPVDPLRRVLRTWRLYSKPTLVAAISFGVLSASLSSATASQPRVVDGVAAIVNGDVITISEVTGLVAMQERSLYQTFGPGEEFTKRSRELRTAALKELIDRKLIVQEFNRQELSIPDRFVRERVDTVIREEFGGDRAAFLKTLQAQGLTLRKFEETERDKVIVQAMRQHKASGSFVASPAKIAEYYAKNPNEFSTQEQVQLRMISISRVDENGVDNRGVVEEIRSKILSGTEFSRMAQTYSEDSMSESGGDWGWIDQQTLNPELTAKAFALKAGEVSEVIEAEDAYYLLKVEARKPATRLPLSEVRSKIEEKIVGVQRQQAFERWIDTLRKKAFIKTF